MEKRRKTETKTCFFRMTKQIDKLLSMLIKKQRKDTKHQCKQ